MIKRLRRKFIKIATLAVTAILLLLSVSLNTANFISSNSALNRTLKMISDNSGTIPHFPPGGKPGDKPGGGNFDKETPFSTRYFVIRYSADGELLSSDFDKIAAVSEADADKYLKIAYKHGEGSGFAGEYKYRVVKTADGYMAVFLDAHRELSSLATTALLSLAATVLCVLLFFIIVVLLSRRAIEPVVIASEKQKQFITDASHELKTPITVIATSIKVLEMETGENKWIYKVRSQTERLTELVNSLVSLSRMDEENPPFHPAQFCISDTVRETAESFEDFAAANGKRLKLDIAPGIAYFGDEYAVRQLISVLADNAVKYSSAGSDIELSLKPGKKGIVIKTVNECGGITREQLDRLFDRFYRADPSRSSARGFGIGLSLARSIAEAHNGSITARSEDGKTVEFTVLLR